MPVNRALRRTAFAAALASLSVAACLGVEEDTGFSTGFGSSSGSFADASLQLIPACSTAKSGMACNPDNPPLICEDSLYVNASCNPMLKCSAEGIWLKDSPLKPCVSIDTCPTAYTESNPTGCAVPFASTVLCEYEEGTCGCVAITDGGIADGGDAGDASDDAGDAGGIYEWRCIHADHDAGCPRKRPRIGAECVRPLSCDYGACVFEDGVEMDCYSGFWTTDMTGSTKCR